MESTNSILGLLNVLFSVVCIFFNVPLLRGTVKRNNMYGYNFKNARKSDENWRKVNMYGSKVFTIWGICLFMVGFVLFLIPMDKNSALLWPSAMAPFTILIPLIITYVYSLRLK